MILAELKRLRADESTSSLVLRNGLWAICNLAAGNAANRTQLGELGACEGEFDVSPTRAGVTACVSWV